MSGPKLFPNVPTQVSIRVGYYVCAYVDLLGQRAQLRELDGDSEFAALQVAGRSEEFQRKLGAVHESIWNFREIVRNHVGKWTPTQSYRAKLTKDEISEVTLAVRSPVLANALSDALVVHSLVDEKVSSMPMVQICSIVYALVFAQLRMLAEGRPIRGGIDLG